MWHIWYTYINISGPNVTVICTHCPNSHYLNSLPTKIIPKLTIIKNLRAIVQQNGPKTTSETNPNGIPLNVSQNRFHTIVKIKEQWPAWEGKGGEWA
jgi:hypothetical protein